jgi:hypothetical protein
MQQCIAVAAAAQVLVLLNRLSTGLQDAKMEKTMRGYAAVLTFSGGRVSVIVSCSPEAPCSGYMNLYASVGSYSVLKPCSMMLQQHNKV